MRARFAFAAASAVAAVALLVGASAASAATTIGQFATLTNPPAANCSTNDRDLLQHLSSGASYVVPPYSATITLWSHFAATGAGQTLTFKVYRKVAEPNTYRVIGADGPRPLDPGVVNNFPVNIAVQAGDVIGLNTANAGAVSNACSEAIGAGDVLRFRSPGLAVGQQNTYNDQPNSRLNVTALVLPDDRITVSEPTLNKKKGTATVVVTVPGPGELTLTGKKVKAAGASEGAAKSVAVSGPGDIPLKIRAKGKTKKKLAENGKATVSYDVSYTPTGGNLRVLNEKVKLKKRLPPG